MNVGLQKALDHFQGKQARLAAEIQESPQLVNYWLQKCDHVPAEYCPRIEAATGGVVRCEDLNPTVEWAVVRATGETQ